MMIQQLAGGDGGDGSGGDGGGSGSGGGLGESRGGPFGGVAQSTYALHVEKQMAGALPQLTSGANAQYAKGKQSRHIGGIVAHASVGSPGGIRGSGGSTGGGSRGGGSTGGGAFGMGGGKGE